MSEFTKEDSRVFVQFENVEGVHRYVLRSSFKPTNDLYTEENKNWVRIFDTSEFIEVEEELEKLLA